MAHSSLSMAVRMCCGLRGLTERPRWSPARARRTHHQDGNGTCNYGVHQPASCCYAREYMTGSLTYIMQPMCSLELITCCSPIYDITSVQGRHGPSTNCNRSPLELSTAFAAALLGKRPVSPRWIACEPRHMHSLRPREAAGRRLHGPRRLLHAPPDGGGVGKSAHPQGCIPVRVLLSRIGSMLSHKYFLRGSRHTST